MVLTLFLIDNIKEIILYHWKMVEMAHVEKWFEKFLMIVRNW